MELERKLSAVKILAEFKMLSALKEWLPVADKAPVGFLGGACSVLCCVVVSCEEC